MRPDDHPVIIPAAPAKRKGGQVRTSVIVRLKPSVFTTLGSIRAERKIWCGFGDIRWEE
jgi:hypothetical protein